MSVSEWEIFSHVLIGMALGGLIGFERGIIGKPAGIRTHMFVAGASTLVVSVGKVLIEQYSGSGLIVSADPTRVLEAVIVGISFIGAGTVLKSSETHHVYYLTTAASILFSAGIGIVVALGLIQLAVVLSVLVILISTVIGQLELRFLYRDKTTKDNQPGNASKT